MIERYDVSPDGYGGCEYELLDDGEWVRFEDVIKLIESKRTDLISGQRDINPIYLRTINIIIDEVREQFEPKA